MRKFISLLLGLGIGAVIGALLVSFFSPLSSDELRAHYERAAHAGRQASARRRAELEEELAALGKTAPKQ